jgi:hypothetical protein
MLDSHSDLEEYLAAIDTARQRANHHIEREEERAASLSGSLIRWLHSRETNHQVGW